MRIDRVSLRGSWLAVCVLAVLPACADDRPPVQAGAKLSSAKFDASLTPRELFFGNPERVAPQLSPDGKQMLFIAPVEGVLNVWVGPANDFNKAQPVTNDKLRGIRGAWFAFDNTHVLYQQDKAGDEDFQLYAIDLKTKKERVLAGGPKVRVQVVGLSEKKKDKIVVGLNDRDESAHDLWVVELATGKKTLLEKNEQNFAGYDLDHDLNVRLAHKPREDGGVDILEKTSKGYVPFLAVPFEDADSTNVVGFDEKGTVVYLFESIDRDSAALVAYELKTKKKTVLFEPSKGEISDALFDPKTHKPQAVWSVYARSELHVLDKAIEADLAALKAQIGEGELSIDSRSLDDKTWLVASTSDVVPAKYFAYERSKKKVTALFSARPKLDGVKLATMEPVEIAARDGLTLVSYLTVPAGYTRWVAPASQPASNATADAAPAVPAPLPLVLLVHGGPWARDNFGYHSQHQWLASRGYAVLSVNFRGSTGFGKKFLNAGNREWAGKMHDDLIDAVKWAVDQKIADAKRVAIMGGSYGGYATLVGLTFTPEQFACGVDIVGPSNIQTLLSTIPPYWKPMQVRFAKMVGDISTEEGRKFLDERSPLFKADKIQRPLLIGQGANDPRVKQAEADQIVKAMTDKGLAVTYVLYPDEGHGFARPANRVSFNAVTETFLSQCLQGPAQPIGEDFKGASITVPVGASIIEGLPAALSAIAPPPAPAVEPASAPASQPAAP